MSPKKGVVMPVVAGAELNICDVVGAKLNICDVVGAELALPGLACSCWNGPGNAKAATPLAPTEYGVVRTISSSSPGPAMLEGIVPDAYSL